jgi:hypothetical protein
MGFDAGVRIDHRLDRHHLLFERGRRRHDLEGGPGLIQILHGAVAAFGLLGIAIGVRIERRLVRHRQNLAGVRIHDDRGAAFGFVRDDARVQFAFGDVLQVLVDRQLNARSGRRRTLEAAERVAARVRLHHDGAGLAADLRVVGVFEAAQPLVVDPHPAEQVRRQLFVRVEALALFDEANAIQVQGGDALRLIRRDLPADVREGLPLAEPLGERLAVFRVAVAERVTDFPGRVGGVVDFRRDGIDRVGVHARCQHAAAAIDDVAALGRRRLRALLLALGAGDEIGALEDLQVDELRLDAGHPGGEHGRNDNDAAFHDRTPVVRGRGRGGRHSRVTAARRRMPPAAPPARHVR